MRTIDIQIRRTGDLAILRIGRVVRALRIIPDEAAEPEPLPRRIDAEAANQPTTEVDPG